MAYSKNPSRKHMKAARSQPDPTWWMCRSRAHVWPERENAEACCHTHRVTPVYGVGSEDWPGPEPVLPSPGRGLEHCWVLVPWSEVEEWRPTVGRLGGQVYGPGPMELSDLSVLSLGYVQEHEKEVEAEMKEWMRRHGWTDDPL